MIEWYYTLKDHVARWWYRHDYNWRCGQHNVVCTRTIFVNERAFICPICTAISAKRAARTDAATRTVYSFEWHNGVRYQPFQ